MAGYRVVERARRRRRARRFGRCAMRCGREISPGQEIGEVRGGWAHMSCLVVRVEDARAESAPAPAT